MNKFYADKFVRLIAIFSKTEIVLKSKGNKILTNEDVEGLREHSVRSLKEARQLCSSMGMIVSVKQINRIIGHIENKETYPDVLSGLLADLISRVADEMSVPVFLVMQPNKVDFYEKSKLFGNEVFNKFPSANFDIEEAGKCFATARYTACVMHLQRVLEIGLKSYGKLLNVIGLLSTPQPSWNLVLDKTRKEIKERNDRHNTKVWVSNEEKRFCEGIQPFLEDVKTAWRNPSMHAEKIYSEEIAEDIFNAVKRFMRNIAKHLDESGKFTP